MKKLALLLVCMFTLISCETDDDSPVFIQAFSVVTEADLPAFFERGETYDIDVTYLLPTACHHASGLQVERGSQTGEARRAIYIAGVSSFNSNLQQCSEEAVDLERTASFELLIDEDEPYTFNLWIGVNSNNEHQYTTITVPVGNPEVDFEEQ